MTQPPPALPKWARDIQQLLGIRAQFVLTGNIRDLVLLGAPDRFVSLTDALWECLRQLSFDGTVIWDPIDGLRAGPHSEGALAALSGACGHDLSAARPMQLESLEGVIRRIACPPAEGASAHVALVIDQVSRLGGAGALPDSLRRFFASAEKTALQARPLPWRGEPGARPALFNPVIWLANRPADLPPWFTAENERVRLVPIPLPSGDERTRAARLQWPGLEKSGTTEEAFAADFAALSDNLSFMAMRDVVALARRQRIPAADVRQAVQSYRVGDLSLQSPWRGEQLRQRILAAENGELIAKRVLGQSKATVKVLDILKRTSIGLTGAQSHGGGSRPRGVLFFAGPTGVGKTEMAKTIAEIVFGDRDAFLRFDMSEYSAEHSEARLIGAPPGYVGHDQGGQLTGALRERPFRVLLFDEIEKAHNRILDKFLQILEDGRLTDGRGDTVFFSDALIIFTSNAGISRRRPDGETEQLVSPETPAQEFERKLEKGVDDYFIGELRRPELLNRLGENIVLFHYIQPEVGRRILAGMIENTRRNVRQVRGVELEIGEPLRAELDARCVGTRLDNGARGISAKMEEVFINPLSRLLFARGEAAGTTVRLSNLREFEHGYELVEG